MKQIWLFLDAIVKLIKRINQPMFAYAIIFLITVGVCCKWINHMFNRAKKSLRGKIILVTGGGNGLGSCVAALCKAKGAKVIIWDIEQAALEDMRSKVDCAMRCDVSEKTCVDECAQNVLRQYGHIDILINNAGILCNGANSSILEPTQHQIRRCFDVNLMAQFWTVQAFLPQMIARKSGHIVTICSTTAFGGASVLPYYSISKWAVRGFNENLSQELYNKNQCFIKTTAIYPHTIKTQGLGKTFLSQVKKYFEKSKGSLKGFLFQAVGTHSVLDVEDVAHSIINAIQYECHSVILPKRIGFVHMMEHFIPVQIMQWIIYKSLS